jgi:ATP-dependent Lon protease
MINDQSLPTNQLLLRLFGKGRAARPAVARRPTETHREFGAGRSGVSYDDLFGPYLAGASRVVITDPYIQSFYQVRNLMELLETIVRHKTEEQAVEVHLITEPSEPEKFFHKQTSFLNEVAAAAPSVGIRLTWEFAPDLHDRSIVTNHGWKIVLGRGLDIFERYNVHDAFDFQNRLQQCRKVRSFEMTVIRV